MKKLRLGVKHIEILFWFDPLKLGKVWDEKNMGAFEDHFKVN
ncbi:hypothetical protein [Algibacter marinivivus]|nr:hypothetical protein [Algibacter marinivivus]